MTDNNDKDRYYKDNNEIPLYSNISENIDPKSYKYAIGIDEAGRGPVLGPLVYAACFAPVENLERIRKLRFDDSKKLSEAQRENMFKSIVFNLTEVLGFVSDVSEPHYLSEKMLAKNQTTLDMISHSSALSLIKKVLDKGYDVDEVYVDTVGPPAKYEAKIRVAFPSISKVTVSKKADSLYPIVSAASICAKVIRDRIISTTNFEAYSDCDISTNTGSGYPSDPTTKQWLRNNRDKVFGYPENVRFSWKTTSTSMQGQCYNVEWTNQQSPFFTGKRKRSIYFDDHNLNNDIVEF